MMWISESFASLDLLLAFANDRRITIERAKVVVAHDADGAERFHLLYAPGDDIEPVLAAVATGEAELPIEAERDEALDAAEAIIHDAQREDG